MSVTIVVGVLVGLAVSGTLIVALRNWISEVSYTNAFRRWRSWCWLVGVIFVPVLAGALWTMLAVMLLSLLCFREYARATGLFREKTICAVVVLGIVLVTFAAVDHWQDDVLFLALGPLVGALIVIVGIPADRPKGFIQRVALGVLGFALLGFSLGYISNMANVVNLGRNGIDYRPLILLLIVAVELNDLLASLTLVGLDQFVPKWNSRAIGLTDIHVVEHHRRQGLGRLLITETLRRLKQETIRLVEAHASESDEALAGLLGGCGFQRVDAGTQYLWADS